MSLFDRIFRKNLTPSWQLTAGGPIWKLLVTDGGLIVGEVRNSERKQVSYFSILPTGGTIVFRDRKVGDDWWLSMEMTIGEIAVLHRYPTPDLPAARGVVMLDCETGEVRWSDDGVRVLCGTSDHVLVERGTSLENRTFQLRDLMTGEVREELGSDTERAEVIMAATHDPDRWVGWINAELLSDVHPEFARIDLALAKNYRQRIGPVEFASFAPYAVATLHVPSDGRAAASDASSDFNDRAVAAHLIVIDGDTVVYDERIADDLPGPGTDHFFILHGTLLFIRDATTLVGIDLMPDDKE